MPPLPRRNAKHVANLEMFRLERKVNFSRNKSNGVPEPRALLLPSGSGGTLDLIIHNVGKRRGARRGGGQPASATCFPPLLPFRFLC